MPGKVGRAGVVRRGVFGVAIRLPNQSLGASELSAPKFDSKSNKIAFWNVSILCFSIGYYTGRLRFGFSLL